MLLLLFIFATKKKRKREKNNVNGIILALEEKLLKCPCCCGNKLNLFLNKKVIYIELDI